MGWYYERGSNSHPCGSRYQEASLSRVKFPNEDASILAGWLKEKKDLLLFTGNPGCGKTYFCASVYNLDKEKHLFHSSRYWHESTLLAKLRTSMENRRDYLEDAKEFCDDHLVIIDDVGSTGIKDWRNEVYYTIIDFRVSNRLPTIITTNLSINEISKEMSSRVYSRLVAKENVLITMNTIDLRQIPIEQR